MVNFTSNTYILKRKILTFIKKCSKQLSMPEKKFVSDITYGMLVLIEKVEVYGEDTMEFVWKVRNPFNSEVSV